MDNNLEGAMFEGIDYKKFKDIEIGVLFVYWGRIFKKTSKTMREDVITKKRFKTEPDIIILISKDSLDL